MTSRPSLLWLRNDLRTLDQPLLALESAKRRAFLYAFDVRFLSRTVELPGDVGALQKASAWRALFVLQSIRDLSKRLKAHLEADLIVRVGDPEAVICDVAEQLKWKSWDVYCQREIGTEEESVEAAVASKIAAHGGQLHASWGMQFLYHPDDAKAALSADPMSTLLNPHHFWQDDADPESLVPIRTLSGIPPLCSAHEFVSGLSASIADPAGMLSLPEAEALVLLGYSMEEAQNACTPDPRAVLAFQGGESNALARLEEWIQSGGLSRYYDDRSGLLGTDYSSKLSPWLATGCISATRVYRRIREERDDESTKWFISELGWRDLFKYHCLFHGSLVFNASGPSKSKRRWANDKLLFEAWSSGTTGLPYVDAHMRELIASGFMSNTGRQLVAAFLSCCLGLDWRLGAMWFESKLIDHDVSLNYGNWNREARVRWAGSGAEPDADTLYSEEHAHLLARLKNAANGGTGAYDTAKFIRLWIPNLDSADSQSLLCRLSPPPIYNILCSGCSAMERSSTLENGRLLCSQCRGACDWCGCRIGEAPMSRAKRKLYCNQCWDDWPDISVKRAA